MPRRKTDHLFKEIEKRVENSDLLTPLEKEETLARAKAHVDEQRKKAAIDRLFQEAVKAEENAYDPNEEIVSWTVDLPEYTPCITVNGRISYYHGLTYEVPLAVYRDMLSQQWQAQCHQREIDGKRRQGDLQRQPLYTDLSPQHPAGRVTTRGNMRV